jgi:hypothetical protein
MLGISGRFEMDVEGHLVPHRYQDNLQVVSSECLRPGRSGDLASPEGPCRGSGSMPGASPKEASDYRLKKLWPAGGSDLTNH